MTVKILTGLLMLTITFAATGCGSGVETSGSESIYMKAAEGKVGEIRGALQNGFKVNTQDDNGRTLLHYAAAGNQLNVAEMLIVNFGADPTLKDVDGFSALDIALQAGDPSMLEMFYNEGYLN